MQSPWGCSIKELNDQIHIPRRPLRPLWEGNEILPCFNMKFKCLWDLLAIYQASVCESQPTSIGVWYTPLFIILFNAFFKPPFWSSCYKLLTQSFWGDSIPQIVPWLGSTLAIPGRRCDQASWRLLPHAMILASARDLPVHRGKEVENYRQKLQYPKWWLHYNALFLKIKYGFLKKEHQYIIEESRKVMRGIEKQLDSIFKKNGRSSNN
jgi:hypothetical protein